MEKFRETVIDSAGNLVAAATITVYATGTTNTSTIYSDDGVTSESNPFTSGSDGVAKFYAADGRYDIKIVKTGFDTVTIVDHQLFDLGITGATGGISNTGNTTIEADSDGTGGGDILLQINGSTRSQVMNNGDHKISTGNLIIGTAGKGIDFSVNSHEVGMTSEILDHYEEGTWTATAAAGGISTNLCTYVKIGSYATLRGRVLYTGGASDSAALGGIPFTADATEGASAGAVFVQDMETDTSNMIQMKIDASGSILNLYSFSEDGLGSAFQSAGYLYFCITYMCA